MNKAKSFLKIDKSDGADASRKKIEKKLQVDLEKALAEQRDSFFVGNLGSLGATSLEELDDPMALWLALMNLDSLPATLKAREALSLALLLSSDLGVQFVLDQFEEEISFSFDWNETNIEARDWALNHSAQLITKVNETTKKIVRQKLANWIEDGTPLSSLIESLAVDFGPQRAQLIASTEVTAAFSNAAKQTIFDSGLVDKVVWKTVVDERVCPICGPLHNKVGSVVDGFDRVGFPPAHPRCRCWIVPYINRKDLIAAVERQTEALR